MVHFSHVTFCPGIHDTFTYREGHWSTEMYANLPSLSLISREEKERSKGLTRNDNDDDSNGGGGDDDDNDNDNDNDNNDDNDDDNNVQTYPNLPMRGKNTLKVQLDNDDDDDDDVADCKANWADIGLRFHAHWPLESSASGYTCI